METAIFYMLIICALPNALYLVNYLVANIMYLIYRFTGGKLGYIRYMKAWRDNR